MIIIKDNQEVFDELLEMECELRYKSWRTKDPKDIEAHKAAQEALEEFAKITGCHN